MGFADTFSPHALSDPNLRSFYAYTPNEVKHRKRTTSAQLKVLEHVFKTDTKPNSGKRTELASQLNMTARGVQVCPAPSNARFDRLTLRGKGLVPEPVSSDTFGAQMIVS